MHFNLSILFRLCLILTLVLTAPHPQHVSLSHTEALVLAAVSTVVNVGIIFYHVIYPPHPKFLLVPKRWWCIRIHLVTGITEICASVASLVIANVYGGTISSCATLASVAGAIHALTALHQTELVFGAKVISHPMYYFAGFMHLVSAIATFASPQIEQRVLAQYLVLCIFTWVRVHIFLLHRINLGTPCNYTLAVFLAGVTVLPFIMGPLSFLFSMIISRYLSAVLWAWCGEMDYHGTDWAELTRERVRSSELLVDTADMDAWRGLPPNATKEESEEAALAAFRIVDRDNNGVIDLAEAQRLLSNVGVHPTVRRLILEVLERNHGQIDFQLFLRSIWNLSCKDWRSPPLEELVAMTDPRQQAKVVFDRIDMDCSGVLERFELAELLVQWGCPADEITAYMTYTDVNGDGQISFEDEFYPKMEVIWKFAYHLMVIEATKLCRRDWRQKKSWKNE